MVTAPTVAVPAPQFVSSRCSIEAREAFLKLEEWVLSDQACVLPAHMVERGIFEKSRQVLRLLMQANLDQRGCGDVGPAIEVRGVDALERIIQEAPSYRRRVLENLAHFLRTGAKAEAPDPDAPPGKRRIPPPPDDVQLAITVIGRRNGSHPEDRTALNLDGSWLGSTTWVGDFRELSLKLATLQQAALTGADLSHADLTRATLEDACLEDTRLEGAYLVHADLRSLTAIRVDLTQALIHHSLLTDACFVSSSMERCNFWESHLDRVTFNGGTLHHADIRQASLRDAVLEAVDVSRAKFDGADVEGADFSGCRGLNVSQVRSMRNWDKAHFPADISQSLGLSTASHDVNEHIG